METEKLKKEIKVYFYRSRGPGGQRKNKKETAVRIYHLPTGITVTATESRFQSENKRLALERLVRKLRKLKEKKKRRISTKKPFGVKRREKQEKIRHSERKKLRSKISWNFAEQ